MSSFKQIVIAVGVIVNEKGEILLGKRNQPETPDIHGKWEFPGGGIEPEEQPEQALLREVKEEAGLEVKIVRLLPKVYTNFWNWGEGQTQVAILAYECRVVKGEPRVMDEEMSELKYFSADEIDYENSLPKTKDIIDLLK